MFIQNRKHSPPYGPEAGPAEDPAARGPEVIGSAIDQF
jgi:hypothetical protein